MTKVLFRTFGHITTITKGNQLEMDLAVATVNELFSELIRRFGEPMRKILYPKDDELSEMLYILINGKNVAYLDGPGTELKEGDIVSVLPMTAGG